MAPVDRELMMETVFDIKRLLLEDVLPRLASLEPIPIRMEMLENGVGALTEWAWCGGCRVTSEEEEVVADDNPSSMPSEDLTPVNAHVDSGDTSVPVDYKNFALEQCETEEITGENEGRQFRESWNQHWESEEDGASRNTGEMPVLLSEIQSDCNAEAGSVANTGLEAASTSGEVVEDSPRFSTHDGGNSHQEAQHYWNMQNIDSPAHADTEDNYMPMPDLSHYADECMRPCCSGDNAPAVMSVKRKNRKGEGAASEASSGSEPDGGESMPSAAADPSSEPSPGPSRRGAGSEVSSGSEPDADEPMPSTPADPSSEPSPGPSRSVTRNKGAPAPVHKDTDDSEQSFSDPSDSGDEYIPPHSSHDNTCAALKRKRKKRKEDDICKMQSDEMNTSRTTGAFHMDGATSGDLYLGLKKNVTPRETTANKKKSESVHTQVKQKLTGHESLRSDDGSYPCSDCDKRYITKWGLQRHCKDVHLGVKPYSCDMCDRKFSREYEMVVHRRTHTGEKPYQCEWCEKCFSSSSHYHLHVRVHKGLKPFHCTTCGRRFGQSAHLHQHMLIHSGEKPFECSTCGKRFVRRGTLTPAHVNSLR